MFSNGGVITDSSFAMQVSISVYDNTDGSGLALEELSLQTVSLFMFLKNGTHLPLDELHD